MSKSRALTPCSCPPYLSAELLRSRNSALQWLPLLALPLVVMTVLFSLLTSTSDDATGVLGWQSLFVTGMYAPLIALFAAVPERREVITRGGGTWWRPINFRRENAARAAVVLLSLAAFHLLNFGGAWAAVAAQGREQHELLLLAGLYSYLGAIGLAGLAAACARLGGFALALMAGAVWQIISILPSTVEAARWWVFPPAWPQRLLLRTLRVHQNSVPLAPEDPLLTSSAMPAILLCVLLAIIGTASAIYAPRSRRTALSLLRRTSTPEPFASGTVKTVVAYSAWRPASYSRSSARFSLLSTVAGLHRAACGPLTIVCLVLSAPILLFLSLVYPASYVEGFFVYLLLPVGAGTLPVLVWPLLSSTWPLVHVETRYGPAGLLLWLFGIVSVVCVASTLAIICAGGNFGRAVAALLLSMGVGYVIAVLSLILRIRFGATSSIALTTVGTVVSATLGGDVLADTYLWLLAFPAWPVLATSPVRYAIAAASTLVLSVAVTQGARHVLRSLALLRT